VYGSLWPGRRWYLQGSAEYGWKDVDSTRSIELASIEREAHGERDGNNLFVSTGFGYAFQPSSRWLLQPRSSRATRAGTKTATPRPAPTRSISPTAISPPRRRASRRASRHVNIDRRNRVLAVLTPYVRYVADHALDDRELGAQFRAARRSR